MAEQKPPIKKPAASPIPFKPKGPPPPSRGPSNRKAEMIVAVIVLLVIVSILGFFFSATGSDGALAAMIRKVVSFIKLISAVVSMIALGLVIYVFIRIRELVEEDKRKLGITLDRDTDREQKNARWERVEQYMVSANPSDWKIGVLEADNMLDEIVEKMGYQGSTLGERMKTISARDFPYLDEVWQAHKLRNAVAHKGTDYPLSRSEAEQAINTYHRVFKELGYIK